ncbi:MAG: gamma carbonic anhydrase family protein [Thermodesulfobacteriota bacterium]
MIKTFMHKSPKIDKSVFIAEDAVVVGEVEIGQDSSVWFKSVIRGDVNYITIGNRTNIQDCSVLHVTTDTHPLIIGNDITVGHRAILHGCTVNDRVLIGMGSIVLDGVVIESDSLIAAGSVITPGTHIPRGKMIMGIPAVVKRDLSEAEIEEIKKSAANYVKNAGNYLSI